MIQKDLEKKAMDKRTKRIYWGYYCQIATTLIIPVNEIHTNDEQWL